MKDYFPYPLINTVIGYTLLYNTFVSIFSYTQTIVLIVQILAMNQLTVAFLVVCNAAKGCMWNFNKKLWSFLA